MHPLIKDTFTSFFCIGFSALLKSQFVIKNQCFPTAAFSQGNLHHSFIAADPLSHGRSPQSASSVPFKFV